MKFTEGYWEKNERANALYAVQAGYAEKIAAGMRVIATFKPILGRADELDVGTMVMEFTAAGKDRIQVTYTHFLGYENREPRFELFLEHQEAEVIISEEEAVLKSGKMTVRVGLKEFYIRFERNGKLLTGAAFKNVGYMRYNRGYATKYPEEEYMAETGEPYMLNELLLTAGTNVYGLGERFTAFVKNGQQIDCWNEDGGTASQISYKNIPFYITNRGYGVFVDHTSNVSFEVASEKVEYVGFSVKGEELRYYVIGGDDMKEIIRNYTDMTGKPALLPAWSFGLWLSTSFTTDYDEKTATEFIEGMEKRNLPLEVFHFDCFWMKALHWCDFEWNNKIFPEPAEMLKRYKERGLKICVWINPYIAQNSTLFAEGKEKGYFLLRKDGFGIKQVDNWQPGMAIVDFTNPEAVKWYQSKLKILLDMGVDCFKTDFGERIPIDVEYHDESNPWGMHNYYTFLYNRAVFELLKRERGEKDAVVFARSATAGGQQFPVHWGGDCTGTFESMAESLRGGLSLTLSGFSYWSHDIGGFEEAANPTVYKRWLQFGILSTHSRLHGSKSYRVPWTFDEEAVEVCRKFTKLKLRLMPYIYEAAVRSNKLGIPVMRPMIMEFEKDPAVRYLDQQYMLGEQILVAPIFNEEGIGEYYLPKGRWTHLLSGEEKEGGRWYTEVYGFDSLPLFVRENTLLPIGNNEKTATYHYPEQLQILVYPLEEDKIAECIVPDEKGNEVLDITARYKDEKIVLCSSGENEEITYLLVNVHDVKEICGAEWKNTERGTVIYPKCDIVEIVFRK